jgi:hypothetical protein
LISDDSRTRFIDDYKFDYHKIKNEILSNPIGIEHKANYSIASPERAFCDRLYLIPGFFFDNPYSLNINKLQEIAVIYPQRVVLEVYQLIDEIRSKTA